MTADEDQDSVEERPQQDPGEGGSGEDPREGPGERGPGEESPREPGEGGEEELRQQLDEQLRKLRVEDLILQSVVSILNLSARRIAKEDERDLEQARAGIEAASGLVELVPEDARPQLREAISELQLLWAKHAGGAGGEGGEPGSGSAADTGAERPKPDREGGASRLWTPGDG